MKLSNKEIFFTVVDLYYRLSSVERESMRLRISKSSPSEFHVVMVDSQSVNGWEQNFRIGCYDNGEFYIEEAFGGRTNGLDLEKINKKLFPIIRDRKIDNILK